MRKKPIQKTKTVGYSVLLTIYFLTKTNQKYANFVNVLLRSWGQKSSWVPNSRRLVGVTPSYVELLLRSCQFSECHRTMHFQNTHTSLPIT